MKKILLSIATIAVAVSASAQDTLTSFFTGTPTIYTSGAGYVLGNNNYGDLAKMQLFDATYGVSSGGTITNLLMSIPAKEDAGGSFRAVIWENTAGEPGAEVGSVTINLADIDTTIAGFSVANGAVIYNVNVMFPTALTIPANESFWAGVVLPATAGDTIGLMSNTDGDFADAATHAGEFWSDGTFHTIGDPANWDLAIALGVFPVVNLDSGAGINENTLVASAYPNPANSELTITMSENATSVAVISMDGKVVASQEVNGTSTTINVANLNSGVYFYEVTAENGLVVRNSFVKN